MVFGIAVTFSVTVPTSVTTTVSATAVRLSVTFAVTVWVTGLLLTTVTVAAGGTSADTVTVATGAATPDGAPQPASTIAAAAPKIVLKSRLMMSPSLRSRSRNVFDVTEVPRSYSAVVLSELLPDPVGFVQ